MDTRTQSGERGWVVRFLDENDDDVRQAFTGPRGFMAARQLHQILRQREDVKDLEMFNTGRK
jgi:hypothetical protein